MKLKPTPRITKKTVTVRELMLQIKKIVLEEPKRANLGMFIGKYKGKMRPASGYSRVTYEQSAELKPACGTVACLAGWGAVLLRPNESISIKKLEENADRVMRDILGYDSFIYIGGTIFSPESMYGEGRIGAPGTHRHAMAIARRIDKFLKEYPERADTVVDVKKAGKELLA